MGAGMMQPVSDELERQEATGAPGSVELTEEKFYHFCEDIREQPNWRPGADKACDYYDGNQLDRNTLRDLEEKGMGPLISNLIAPTIDLVLGMEAKTRADWRVGADDDRFQDVAEALSQLLHTDERETRADRGCSDAYASQVKAGLGWAEVSRNADPFKYPYRVMNPHRREIYWDWRAREPDLQDGRYLIRRRWFDIDEAIAYFPGKAQLIQAAGMGWGPWFVDLELGNMTRSDLAQSFDQESRHYIEDLEWRDITRRRVCFYETWYRSIHRGYVLKLPDTRVVELNLRNPAQAAAIARGMLKPIPAVYSKWGMGIFMGPHKLVDYGARKKYHPYIPFWGKREDLTGIPYGLIRAMISPQEEVNARRQKMMWLLSASRTVMDADALDQKVNTTAEVLDEINRPDAGVILNPNRKNRDQYAFRVEQNFQLANQQFEVMQNAEEVIQKVAGVFNAMLGRDERAQSGLAINSLVEQGAAVLGEVNDNYHYSRRLVGERLLDLRREDMVGQEVEMMVGEAPKRRMVMLNKPVLDQATGMRYLHNDIERSPVKVALEDVPSSPTYRQQLFTMMGEVIKGLPPQVQAVVVPFWLEASDHPKRKDMAEQVRKMLGIQGDGEQDPEKMQLMAIVEQLQAALQEATTGPQAAESRAKVEKIMAEVEHIRRKSAAVDTQAKGESAKRDVEMVRAVTDMTKPENVAAPGAGPAKPAQPAAGGGDTQAVGRAVESVSKAVEKLSERMERLTKDVASAGEGRGDGLKKLTEQLNKLRDEIAEVGESKAVSKAVEDVSDALDSLTRRVEKLAEDMADGEDRGATAKELTRQLDALREEIKTKPAPAPEKAAPTTIILDSTGKAVAASEGSAKVVEKAVEKAVDRMVSAIEKNNDLIAESARETVSSRARPQSKQVSIRGADGKVKSFDVSISPSESE